ncbi:hypothetical protein KSF_080280 [Reticulibacter mediterranei]|uniref:Uncharacterized protein n=1 Tax=Reticulibacter mediterranei TaxID=2778369 RepID=A0A8J3IW94_9CHLR|nr:hypothetical protein [Reticulibacter mediterranei]GHO97980.1 hypothetical protein KSF_080280 [Reticulibacter mediterranei]
MLKQQSSIPEPLQILSITADEVTAISDAIFAHLCYLRHMPSNQHQEQMLLLHQFQQRLLQQTKRPLPEEGESGK